MIVMIGKTLEINIDICEHTYPSVLFWRYAVLIKQTKRIEDIQER